MDRSKTLIFPAEVIDEQDRHDKHRDIDKFAGGFQEQIEKLASEGVLDASDMDSINHIANMTEADYISHVQGLFKAYLSRIGFCPIDERKRIASNFDAMLERTRKAVVWLHRYKASGYDFKMGKDGKVIADTEQAHDKVNRDTATPIDAKALAEYYKQWESVVKAFEQLNEYERKHDLSETKIDAKIMFSRYQDGHSYLAETTISKLIRDFRKDETKDMFFQIFAKSFKQ